MLDWNVKKKASKSTLTCTVKITLLKTNNLEISDVTDRVKTKTLPAEMCSLPIMFCMNCVAKFTKN